LGLHVFPQGVTGLLFRPEDEVRTSLNVPKPLRDVLAPGKLEKGGRDVRSIIGNLSVESCG
jgi:hypothetical protein